MRIAVLGSTGSIGTSALEVLRWQPGFTVQALSGLSRLDRLCDQARACKPHRLIVANEEDARSAKRKLGSDCPPEILHGKEGLKRAATHADTDWVLNALAGPSGLLPTFHALEKGKRVLLANKESLVSAGELLMRTARRNRTLILPIDSEHNAILRCLPADYALGEDVSDYGVQSIWLTASGGPLLNHPKERLDQVDPDQACDHPNWSMGRKISVDSATLMNKGLELIEAHILFRINSEKIKIVIHPQSIIHCLVEYCDGSFNAQLSQPDMKLAIHQALHYPKYKNYSGKKITPLDMKKLTFESADQGRFPCLSIAKQAVKEKGAALVVMNAADNTAVHGFLSRSISFTHIPKIISETMRHFAEHPSPENIEEILRLERKGASHAQELVEKCS